MAKYKALKDFQVLRTGESFKKGKVYELFGYQAESYVGLGYLEEVEDKKTADKASKDK